MHIFLWEDDIKYNEKFVVVLAYYSRYVVPNVHWGAIGSVWYILPILFFVIVISHPIKLYLSTKKNSAGSATLNERYYLHLFSR